MINAEDLIALVRQYNPKVDAESIVRAYNYGKGAHEGQYRSSGEDYFNHPLAVASILTQFRLDDATIITALLHDTIEDTKSSFDEIKNNFGSQIAELVDGVTKLTNLQLSSVETKQAENFRKLLMAMSKDLRVLLVKLADRLHNMRTIKALIPETQVKKAKETMDIYAPLAGRMGMQSIREELEDLSFGVLNPDARNSIIRRFVNLKNETGDLIPKINDDILIELKKIGVDANVNGREKRPYSIWRKMEERKEGFHRLSDIYGFRIITNTALDCYSALGAVHRRWRAVPGRFKDYVSQPKSNGYRSLHTTVSGRDGKRVEVQIRTQEMHQVAESGVAAHWSYKDGFMFENSFAVDPFKWIKGLAADFEESENPDDFLEHVKLEMFQDKVFCFTPNGEVVKLPRGATPIDFAYAIHTRIGDSCVGAKIDGQRKPLWTRLRNGQSVSIIRADGQRPQSSWEEIAITGRAKTAIRRSIREEYRSSYIKLGSEISRVAFERIGKRSTEKALLTAAKKLSLSSSDDLLAAIGAAEITGHDLIKILYPNFLNIENIPFSVNEKIRFVGLPKGQSAIPASCCQPVPDERIVGIMVKGKGVYIHTIDCASLEFFDREAVNWIDLKWPNGEIKSSYSSSLSTTMVNGAGVLGRICTLVGEMGANITDMIFLERKQDFYRIKIEINISDIEHLSNIITAIEADTDIAEVKRFRDPTNHLVDIGIQANLKSLTPSLEVQE